MTLTSQALVGLCMLLITVLTYLSFSICDSKIARSSWKWAEDKIFQIKLHQNSDCKLLKHES